MIELQMIDFAPEINAKVVTNIENILTKKIFFADHRSINKSANLNVEIDTQDP